VVKTSKEINMEKSNRPAIDNIVEILKEHVGMTVASSEIRKLSKETISACSSALWHLNKEGHLCFEKKVGQTNIYQVLPSIRNRKSSKRDRKEDQVRKHGNKATKNGYKIERGISMPGGRLITPYPFYDMEVGDSFQAPLERAVKIRRESKKVGVEGPGKGWEFMVKKVSTKVCRCWRVK